MAVTRHVVLLRKRVSTDITFEPLFPSVDTAMASSAAPRRECFSADATTVRLFASVDPKMACLSALLSKTLATYITGEGFIPSVYPTVYCQSVVMLKRLSTVATFVRLFPSVVSSMIHLSELGSKRLPTDTTAKGPIPSVQPIVCCQTPFCGQPPSTLVAFVRLFLSVDLTMVCKTAEVSKRLATYLTGKGFIPQCVSDGVLSDCAAGVNAFPQSRHLYGFSPVWRRTMACKSAPVGKCRPTDITGEGLLTSMYPMVL